MAFFCPMPFARRRRRKRFHEEEKNSASNGAPRGRITGSDSIDSLVNIGRDDGDDEVEFEPRKMVVLHDFIPCVEDEVAVKRGQFVKALYQETDWIYVITNEGKEGFIPFTYCIPEDEYEKKKDKQRSTAIHRNNFRNTSFLDSLNIQTSNPDDSQSWTFVKSNFGDYIVRFDFDATDENDITAAKGERVTVLNKDDQDWFWVMKQNRVEGFIPKDFLLPVNRAHQNGEVSPLSTQTISSGRASIEPLLLVHARTSSSSSSQGPESPPPLNANTGGARPRRNTNELLLYGQELVCIDSSLARREDELTIYKGDWIYADMKHKNNRGWIWAYSPSTKCQGYVPKSCLRPPATTPL